MASKKELLADILLLSQAARRVLQEEVVEEFQDRELNIPRLNILGLLAHRGAQSVNNLALFLGLSKAAASQNTDILSRKGLVFRRVDEADRRTTWVEITKHGQALLGTAERSQSQRIRKALAPLPPKFEKEAREVLRKLALTLIRASGSSDRNCLQACAFGSSGCLKESGGWSCTFRELAKIKD